MNKNKSKTTVLITVIVIVLAVLFIWPKFTNPSRAVVKTWKAADVGCLPAHTNANQHIHPTLKIITDSKEKILPANIGVVQGCMAELHTHAADGVIHLESVSAGKEFTLSQFFTVWGKTLDRPGFKLEVTADGNPASAAGDFILKDKQGIILNYSKISE